MSVVIKAVIIAKIFCKKNDVLRSTFVDTLSPAALLPICNRPLIDYLVMSLVEEGYEDILILSPDADFEKVDLHVQSSLRPSLHTSCSSIMSKKLPASVDTMADTFEELRHHNLDNTFLLVPLDALCYINNLRELGERHMARLKECPSLKMTAIVQEDGHLLRESYHDLVDAAYRFSNFQSPHDDSQFFEHHLPASSQDFSVTPHMTFVIDPDLGTVAKVKQWAANMTHDQDEETRAAAVSEYMHIFIKKGQKCSVRTDLTVTGFCFCEVTVLHNANQFPFSTIEDALEVVVSIDDRVLAIDFISDTSVVLPINSLVTYIHTNISVGSRLLYPLTPESNFGSCREKYSVARTANLVMPTSQSCLAGCVRGSCVFGGGEATTVFPRSSYASECVVGNDVIIGSGVRLNRCVIQNGTVIGDGCELVHCTIGAGSYIENDISLSYCLVGPGVQVLRESGSTTTNPICNDVNCRMYANNTLFTHETVGSKWASNTNSVAVCRPLPSPTMPPMYFLFSYDVDEELEEDDDEEMLQQWVESVAREIRTMVESPNEIPDRVQSMKQMMISLSKGMQDLLEIIFTELFGVLEEMVREQHDEEDEEEEDQETVQLAILTNAMSLLKSTLFAWRTTLFRLLKTAGKEEEEMECILRGLCKGLHQSKGFFGRKAKTILGLLYCNLDANAFDEQGYCIVSKEAILLFDSEITSRYDAGSHEEEVSQGLHRSPRTRSHDDEEDREVWEEVWGKMSNLVQQLRYEDEESEDEGDTSINEEEYEDSNSDSEGDTFA